MQLKVVTPLKNSSAKATGTRSGTGTFWPIFLSNALLSALSIANLGMISSMVGFLHDQKDNVGTYQVNWPDNTVQLKVEPERLWVDQGHESNGVAGYGFFLGLFGLYVAWRQRRRQSTVSNTFVSSSITRGLWLIILTDAFQDASCTVHTAVPRGTIHTLGRNFCLPGHQSNRRSDHFLGHRTLECRLSRK